MNIKIKSRAGQWKYDIS